MTWDVPQLRLPHCIGPDLPTPGLFLSPRRRRQRRTIFSSNYRVVRGDGALRHVRVVTLNSPVQAIVGVRGTLQLVCKVPALMRVCFWLTVIHVGIVVAVYGPIEAGLWLSLRELGDQHRAIQERPALVGISRRITIADVDIAPRVYGPIQALIAVGCQGGVVSMLPEVPQLVR